FLRIRVSSRLPAEGPAKAGDSRTARSGWHYMCKGGDVFPVRMTKIKILQFGLGPIGLESLKLAAEQSWLEIVGGVDVDPAKVGQSLGALTGLPALAGVPVYPSLAAAFAAISRPDVILHTASSSAAAAFEQ